MPSVPRLHQLAYDVALLDACAAINLYACRHMPDILRAVPSRCAIVERVQRESLYVRRGGGGDDARDLEAIDFTDLIAANLLQVIHPTDEELGAFIDLTMRLGDGEAMTVAVALQRGYAVVTDDRVAVSTVAGRVPVLSSLEAIANWVDRERVPAAVVTAALRDLRERGSYLPGRSHHLRPWWERYMTPG